MDATRIDDPIFIGGVPRSGTTLLRVILDRLGARDAIRLDEVLATAPLEQGLAELIGYLERRSGEVLEPVDAEALDGDALGTLRTQAATFGSNMSIVQARQEFTKNTINVLQIGADNLTLADTNEESANMLALQTRQQLSTVALSLASQADQAVLRLF